MDKEKNILNDEELEKAAGGYDRKGTVSENDSCDRFKLSFICSMFGGSNEKICKNCDYFNPVPMDAAVGMTLGGICNAK